MIIQGSNCQETYQKVLLNLEYEVEEKVNTLMSICLLSELKLVLRLGPIVVVAHV